MNLFSLEFVILLTITYFLFYLFPKRFQWICLLLASIVFYAFSGFENLIFILITSFSTWLCSLAFSKIEDNLSDKVKGLEKDEKKRLKDEAKKKKRLLFWAVILLNFGILAVFKYLPDIAEFIISVKNNDGGNTFSLRGLLLPLGISFYTFQTMGYLIDCYNGKYEKEDNYPKFLLFVSFFPQLIQGPINRYDSMRDQLFSEHYFDWEKTKEALLLISFGLLKKYAIANVLSEGIAYFLDEPSKDIPGSVVVTAILMYSAFQYADFSGGIDIVLGIAKLFGIDMCENFRQPYFAVSLGDFWRRWHISLGAWMKDYVFYPFALTHSMQKLGKASSKKFGREVGRLIPACVGNLLVFFIVGIWHGARLHYILWGLYNGLVIALSELLDPVFAGQRNRAGIKEDSRFLHIFRVVRTFIIVNIGWYFDRIEGFGDTLLCFKNTICYFKISLWKENIEKMISEGAVISNKTLLVSFIAVIVVFSISIMHERGFTFYGWLSKKPAMLRYAVYFGLLAFLQLSMSVANVSTPFMYAVF